MTHVILTRLCLHLGKYSGMVGGRQPSILWNINLTALNIFCYLLKGSVIFKTKAVKSIIFKGKPCVTEMSLVHLQGVQHCALGCFLTFISANKSLFCHKQNYNWFLHSSWYQITSNLEEMNSWPPKDLVMNSSCKLKVMASVIEAIYLVFSLPLLLPSAFPSSTESCLLVIRPKYYSPGLII